MSARQRDETGPVEGPSWAEHPELVDFYTRHRRQPADLYPSERRFLGWLARRSASVIDAGCAAGGFSHIWRHYRPDIAYTGIDVSASLVAAARQLHPDLRFEQAHLAAGCNLPDRAATTVQALGWLFWESQYERAIAELWRLAGRYLFFDLRLVRRSGDATRGSQRVAYSGTWDGTTTTPYITVEWPAMAQALIDLQPKALFAYGYWGRPADTVEHVPGDVCFAVFVLEKRSPDERSELPVVCVDMPLPWPASVGPAQVLESDRLAKLVPSEEEKVR